MTELIPVFSCYDDPAFETLHGVIDMKANYELITDNLLDLTHGEFVHEGLLSSEAITISKLETLESGSTVWANRWCPNDRAPPVWGQVLRDVLGLDLDTIVDHWLYMRWDAPAHLLLDVGITPLGKTREDGIWVYAAHHITPVDATRSLYHWAIVRNHGLGDPAIGRLLARVDRRGVRRPGSAHHRGATGSDRPSHDRGDAACRHSRGYSRR